MIKTEYETIQKINDPKFEDFIFYSNNNEIDATLFKFEIRICIAYCDSLFEAGVFNRLETERIKNALHTILKRSEFDNSYFENNNTQNLYQFIDEKLIKLIGDLGLKIKIGRSYFERNSTLIRFWLREEINQISDSLKSIQAFFINLAEKNKTQKFLIEVTDSESHPILFAHWCLANFEFLKRDRERFDEVWRRLNTLPLGTLNGLGTSLEFDRGELAKRLGFQRITTNSLDAFRDMDFITEFTNASALNATHLVNLLDELKTYQDTGYFSLGKEVDAETLTLIKANLQKVLIYQSELQNYLQSNSIRFNKKFKGISEAIIGCVFIFKHCLNNITQCLNSLELKKEKVNEELNSYLPDKNEIADYLIQRNGSIANIKNEAEQVEILLHTNQRLGDTRLEDLLRISPSIEADFFDELSLDKTINQKDQVGGTSYERVSESIDDARRILQYEESDS